MKTRVISPFVILVDFRYLSMDVCQSRLNHVKSCATVLSLFDDCFVLILFFSFIC